MAVKEDMKKLEGLMEVRKQKRRELQELWAKNKEELRAKKRRFYELLDARRQVR